MTTVNTRCQCENNAHIDPDVESFEECQGVDTTRINTIYGVFAICLTCWADHPLPVEFLERPGETDEMGARHAIINIALNLEELGVDADIAQHQAYHMVKDFSGVDVAGLGFCSLTCDR